MGWEERNGNLYYYRKKRNGDRVKSEYVGKGELASLMFQFDEMERDERQIEAEKQRKNREKVEETDRNLMEIEKKTRSLIEIYLMERGFYKTKSREWRLKAKWKIN